MGDNTNRDLGRIRHAVADAGILDAAGDAGELRLAEFILNRFQRGFGAGAGFDDLPGGGHVAVIQRVLIAELPAVKAALLAEVVDAAFQREGGLVDAEAAHGAAGQIVGVNGCADDIGDGEIVGAGGVAGRALQHFHADRGVSAGIADEAAFAEDQHTGFVAADGVFHPDGMALGVHDDGFIAGQAHLDRRAHHVSRQRRMPLHGQVFLAAESAAVGHQHHAHRFLRQAQQLGYLYAVFKDTLPLREHFDAYGLPHREGGTSVGSFRNPPIFVLLPLPHLGGGRGVGVGNTSLRLHKAMLDHLGFVDALRCVGGIGHGLFQVAAIGDGLRQDIAALVH